MDDDVDVTHPVPARRDPETAKALHRYLLRAISSLVAGAAALALSLSMMDDADQRQSELEREGERVVGQVVAVIDTTFGPDGFDYDYLVAGQRHLGTVQPGHRRQVGDTLIVYVDTTDPTRSTVADERPQEVTTFRVTWTLFVFGLGGVLAGLLLLIGTRVLVVVLRSGPWETRPFAVRRRMLGGAVLVDEGAGDSMAVDRRHVRLLRLDGVDARLRTVRRGRLAVVAAVDGRPRLVAGRLRKVRPAG